MMPSHAGEEGEPAVAPWSGRDGIDDANNVEPAATPPPSVEHFGLTDGIVGSAANTNAELCEPLLLSAVDQGGVGVSPTAAETPMKNEEDSVLATNGRIHQAMLDALWKQK